MPTIRKLFQILQRPRYIYALLKYGAAAGVEHREVVQSLEPDVLVDVGANIGQFSLLFRELRSNGRIIAFEPLAEAANTYRQVFRGDDRVTLHQSAIGPDRKQADMHVSKRMDSSSLLPITKAQVELFPGTEEAGRESVTIAPLTDYLRNEDLVKAILLKIDVQGFELEVLRSAVPLLPQIDWIYVEASFLPLYSSQALVHDIVEFLISYNYRLQGIYNPTNDKRGLIAQADFLFARNA